MNQPQDTGEPTSPQRTSDVTDYIADMVAELQHLAASSGHEALAEVLRIASREAERARPKNTTASR